jgi:hypothetical protein
MSGPAPALSSTDGLDVDTIDGDDTVVVDASVSTEGAGYVQASAVGTATGAADNLWCSLSETTTFDDGSVQKVSLVADTLENISAMRTFEVTEASELTVSLVCKSELATAVTVANPQLTLTYIPAEIAAPTT